MKKPEKIARNPIYNYSEIEQYINKKYKINVNNYKYEDFWDWLCDATFLENDSDNRIPLDMIDDEDTPEPIVEILKMFKAEFGVEGEDEIEVRHSW